MPFRLTLAAISAAFVLVALPASAPAQSRTSLYDTFLVSKARDGGMPDGPSRNAAFSQDGRRASILAFEPTRRISSRATPTA